MALTKYNYNSFDVTPVASAGLAFNSGANGLTSLKGTSKVLIKTLTASSSAILSFVDGTSDVVLDNTYPIYVFKFINIHPATNAAEFVFNVSIDTGSNYNVSKTTTTFQSLHSEDGTTAAALGYDDEDLANGTGFQNLAEDVGSDNDQAVSGELWLFNPSSTTFTKHFTARIAYSHQSDIAFDFYVAGHANTASAVDAAQFKFSTGNIDAGSIKLYGIKDS